MVLNCFRSARRSIAPAMLLACLGCQGCPPTITPPTSGAKYLAVVPNELDIYVANPAKGAKVILYGMVYDQYWRVIPDAPLTFKFTDGTTEMALASVGTSVDSMELDVNPTTSMSSIARTIAVSHAASGLSVTVPVTVHFVPENAHGVEADPVDTPWFMVGVVSGRNAGDWKRTMARAFVRRTRFGKFVDDAPVPPGDLPSGTVLSSVRTLWREVNPWTTVPADVQVPTGAAGAPAVVPIRLFFAGDNFAANQAQFFLDAEAGADILGYTLVGISVTVSAPERLPSISWDENCATLGAKLAGLPASQQPSTAYIAVYMLDFAGATGGDRGLHCGPGSLAVSPAPLASTHAIFLPQGGAAAQAAFAHEVGHALSLQHVSGASGFFDDNLMVETDDASARMRSRLTIGQAFRAALDPNSWLVGAGLAKSGPIDCSVTPLQCPDLVLDALRRVP